MKPLAFLILVFVFGPLPLSAVDKILTPESRVTFGPTEMMKGRIVPSQSGEHTLTCDSFSEFTVEMWIFETKTTGRLEPIAGNMLGGKPQAQIRVILEKSKEYSFLANPIGSRPQINGVFSIQALQFSEVGKDLTTRLVENKTPGALKELPTLNLSLGTSGFSLLWNNSGLHLLENGNDQPWVYQWRSPWEKLIPAPRGAKNATLGQVGDELAIAWTEKADDLYALQWRQMASGRWISINDKQYFSPRSRLSLIPLNPGQSFTGFWEPLEQGARLRVLSLNSEGFFTPLNKLWNDNDPSTALWVPGGAGDFHVSHFAGAPIVSLITPDEAAGIWYYSGTGWENLQAMEVKQPQKIFLTSSRTSVFAGWLAKGKLIFQEWQPDFGWKALPELNAYNYNSALAWGGALWILQSDGRKILIQRNSTGPWETVLSFDAPSEINVKQIELVESQDGENSLWAAYLGNSEKNSTLRMFQVY